MWEVFSKQVEEEPLSPLLYNDEIPSCISDLTLFLMQKDPNERPSAAEAVSQVFKNYLKDDREEPGETVRLKAYPGKQAVAPPVPVTPVLFAAPLVGRNTVLGQITPKIDLANHGVPTSIMITGEMGMGKTRLLDEIAPKARLKGFTVLRGSSLEIAQFPYSSFMKPLDIIAQRLNSRDIEDRTDILEGRAAVLAMICPRFGEVSDSTKTSILPELDPVKEKFRQFDAIKTVFFNYAKKKQLLLLIDDLHWADSLSVELFNYLARALSVTEDFEKTRLLLIGTCDPSESDRNAPLDSLMTTSDRYLKLDKAYLEGLDEKNVQEIVSIKLGWKTPLKRLVKLISEQSNGNPLYIEEIMQDLIDQEILIKTGDTWNYNEQKIVAMGPARQDDTVGSSMFIIPETIRHMITRRLDQLQKETRLILSQAAVIGSSIAYELLLELIPQDEDHLMDALDEAFKENILKEAKDPKQQKFQFHHPMIQKVLYMMLPSYRRTNLHKKIGRLLETKHGRDNPEVWDILAFHYDRAELPIEAMTFYLMSAKSNLAKYAIGHALECSQRITDLIQRTTLSQEQHFAFLHGALRIKGRCQEITGEYDKAIKNYLELIQVSARSNNTLEEAFGCYYLGGLYLSQGKLQNAYDLFQKTIELLPSKTGDDQTNRTLAINGLAEVLMKKGRYREATELYMKVRSIMLEIENPAGLAMCELNLGMIHYYQGHYDNASEWIYASIDKYEKLGNYPNNISKAYNNLSGIYLALGDTEAALDCGLKSLKTSREIGDIHSISAVQGNLGLFYFEVGQYDEAAESYRESLNICKNLNDQTGVGVSMINLGNLKVELWDQKGAFDAFTEAIQIIQETGERWLSAYAQNGLGELYLHQNNIDAAARCFSEGITVCRDIGLKVLELQCAANLAWLHELEPESAAAPGESCLSLLDEAIQIGDSDAILLIRARLSEIHINNKEFDAARKTASAGLKFAVKRNHKGYQWRFMSAIGRAAYFEGKNEHAYRALKEAADIIFNLCTTVADQYADEYLKHPEVERLLALVFPIAESLGRTSELTGLKELYSQN